MTLNLPNPLGIDSPQDCSHTGYVGHCPMCHADLPRSKFLTGEEALEPAEVDHTVDKTKAPLIVRKSEQPNAWTRDVLAAAAEALGQPSIAWAIRNDFTNTMEIKVAELAVERCALLAESAFDDRRPGYRNHDWEDGYRDGCRAAAAAIRAEGKL